MQATAALGPINDLIDTYGKELTREMRREVGRKMGGLGSLLPKGGDAVWGSDVITLSSNETLGLDAIVPDLLAVLGPHTGGYDLDARLPTLSRGLRSARRGVGEPPEHGPTAWNWYGVLPLRSRYRDGDANTLSGAPG